MRVYLDWAASSPPDPEILDLQRRVAEDMFANPSSLHTMGRKAQEALHQAREKAALSLGTTTERIYFTSGATESNNIVFTSLLLRRRDGHVVTSAIEHSSAWEPALLLKRLGYEVTSVRPRSDGILTPEDVVEAVRPDTLLVSVMLVNNETGAIQPVREIAEAVRERAGRRVHIHSDVVQAVGKIPVDLEALGVDSASVSMHKFRGPRGVGILYLARQIEVLYAGGGQEWGMRPGTENLPGIVAGSEALVRAVRRREEGAEQASRLMGRLIEGLCEMKGVQILPEERLTVPERYSPFILTVSFPPVPGEVIQRVLNDAGFAVSTGSACASHKGKGRRVLDAMGIPEEVSFSSIRISIGPDTTEDDIEEFLRYARKELPLLMKVAR
ncbi:aminotransferase class V [Spirochaeta thermophila DSM 6578]|uniref:Aminotransferase class V n=1 Tax=Winmispira thermophila (strain ATCC 700085 / DSM 6578 / Z-1203) TaxID=869211 RepID=G0GB90_WINT7|nr:cysteine desulfurase family protein [Spirochaeta thermophila]AEJ61899.1 aminotransferase class V [Spirochaeta thermophila DSM 6578]